MKKFIFIVLLTFMFSCEEIIEVEDISNEVINILAPSDASILTITDINFAWNPVGAAEQYQLQIATPNFEDANQVVLDTTIMNTNFTQALDLGGYEWRVRGLNSDFQTNFTSQSFTVED